MTADTSARKGHFIPPATGTVSFEEGRCWQCTYLEYMTCRHNDCAKGVYTYSYSRLVRADGNHFDVTSELYD
jgi:hypothetical protein